MSKLWLRLKEADKSTEFSGEYGLQKLLEGLKLLGDNIDLQVTRTSPVNILMS